jgi:hypothetical protein
MADWIKRALTRRTTDKTAVADEATEAATPSESLVLGVKFPMALAFSLTAMEIAHLALLGTWNSEIFAAQSKIYLFWGRKRQQNAYTSSSYSEKVCLCFRTFCLFQFCKLDA